MLHRTSISQKQTIEWGSPGALGRGTGGDVDQGVQVFSYKMNK